MEFFVGTYSRELAGMAGHGEGIYLVPFDPEDGAFGAPKLLTKCINPSALALSPDGKTLFAVREVFADDGPAMASFRVSPEGELKELSHMPLAGELPCHLVFEPKHERLASAQFWTGDVAISSVADGVIAPPVHHSRTGTGPVKEWQEGPHAHFIAFTDSGTVSHHTDLGTDSIVSHRLDDANSSTETNVLQLPAGSGPRHMALTRNERRAYVFCQLDESLVSLSRKELGWEITDVRPGFPAPVGDEVGLGSAIRLSPDERHLYLSGRRQSQIACFEIGKTPKSLGTIGTGGEVPREFIVTSDGDWVIAANQNSNTLTCLRRDRETGLLSLGEHNCTVGSPVALVER